MNQQTTDGNAALWERLVECNLEYSRAFRAFCAEGVQRVPWVRKGLHSGGIDRATALTVLPYMSVAERLELFSDLVDVARAAHGPVDAVWKLILSLPRDWVLAHIEQEVEPILRGEEEDDYWMFLQLYAQLDRDLTRKLAHRAAAHS